MVSDRIIYLDGTRGINLSLWCTYKHKYCLLIDFPPHKHMLFTVCDSRLVCDILVLCMIISYICKHLPSSLPSDIPTLHTYCTGSDYAFSKQVHSHTHYCVPKPCFWSHGEYLWGFILQMARPLWVVSRAYAMVNIVRNLCPWTEALHLRIICVSIFSQNLISLHSLIA